MPEQSLAGIRAHGLQAIRQGSRSFALAARLFGAETRDAAHFVYAWCRRCDDEIDGAPDAATRLERLSALRARTASVFRGEPQADPAFSAFQYVTARYRIPQAYADALLDGMEMDSRGERYDAFPALRLYCYRVAGVVGLMMTHVMGVSDERALANAADLGIGMQLTNIARDVLEDHAMGRVYLPESWLKECGLTRETLARPEYQGRLYRVVARLLDAADGYYGSGVAGLDALSFRAALAVSCAASIYQEIGRMIEAGAEGLRGEWPERMVVPRWRKGLALARGIYRVARRLPWRLARRWRPVPITRVWEADA